MSWGGGGRGEAQEAGQQHASRLLTDARADEHKNGHPHAGVRVQTRSMLPQ